MVLRHVAVLAILGAFLLTLCSSQSVDEEERLEGIEGSGNLGLDDEDRVEGSGLPPEPYADKKLTTARPKPTTKKVAGTAPDARRTSKGTTVTVSTRTTTAFETKAEATEVASTKKVVDATQRVSSPPDDSIITPSSESTLSQINFVTLLVIVTVVIVVIIIIVVLIYIVKKRSGSNRDYKPGVPVNRT